MWSVLSLRRLASHARRMWYADNPRPFGPGPIGWYTFVANTISSRRPLRCSHRPTTSSAMPYPWVMSGVCGPPYTSAVSKKLMPASLPASMIAKLVASSVVNPNVMVPSPIRLTMRPDRPRCPYVLASFTFPRIRIALLS